MLSRLQAQVAFPGFIVWQCNCGPWKGSLRQQPAEPLQTWCGPWVSMFAAWLHGQQADCLSGRGAGRRAHHLSRSRAQCLQALRRLLVQVCNCTPVQGILELQLAGLAASAVTVVLGCGLLYRTIASASGCQKLQ
jgi:hypothetical protein